MYGPTAANAIVHVPSVNGAGLSRQTGRWDNHVLARQPMGRLPVDGVS